MKTETTTTVYRRANIAKTAALESLVKRFPDADVVSFVTKKASAEEAAANGLREGELVFAATIREAEFPPKDEGGDDEPADDGPAESESSDSPPSDDSESSDDGPKDDAPDGPPSEGGEKPKKLSPDEQIIHLLSEILTALKGGGGPAGPDAGLDAGPGDLDLPDVGAPPAGGPGLPPPHKAPPLPPPAKPKAPMGGPAFSHYDPEAPEFTTIRVKASEVGNKALIDEALVAYPTHKVARIQRTGSATLEGKRYNLPENDVAVVTLEKA